MLNPVKDPVQKTITKPDYKQPSLPPRAINLTYTYGPSNQRGYAKPFVYDLNDPAGRSMSCLFHHTNDCSFGSLNGLTGFYLNRNRLQDDGSVLFLR